MSYKVLVDDNFHYRDETERYELGEFPTPEAALEAVRKIVDDFLQSECKPGMTAEELFHLYAAFGEDPFIVPQGEDEGIFFSAWAYARLRAGEMCSG